MPATLTDRHLASYDEVEVNWMYMPTPRDIEQYATHHDGVITNARAWRTHWFDVQIGDTRWFVATALNPPTIDRNTRRRFGLHGTISDPSYWDDPIELHDILRNNPEWRWIRTVESSSRLLLGAQYGWAYDESFAEYREWEPDEPEDE